MQRTVELGGKITDDLTLSDSLDMDAELIASYSTDEEILKNLMDNNKNRKSDSKKNEDVIQKSITSSFSVRCG